MGGRSRTLGEGVVRGVGSGGGGMQAYRTGDRVCVGGRCGVVYRRGEGVQGLVFVVVVVKDDQHGLSVV